MIPNWLDSYYEALEFFYWEPQHLGLKKNVSNELDTIEKVEKHLRKMEVTLNHNTNQFLLLAPVALRTRLFQECFNRTFGSFLAVRLSWRLIKPINEFPHLLRVIEVGAGIAAQ